MDSPPASPHAAYDRWMRRQRRWGARWRRFGQIVFYVFGAILTVVLALLLIASLFDLGQPRIWGTFTQTKCEPRLRGGCDPVGTWISDDRTIVLHDVDLDGATDETGTTRASYQPTALLGDDIVHVPMFSGTAPWLTGAILLGWVGYLLHTAGTWGDLPLPRSRRLRARRAPGRRQGDLGIRGSFRRRYRRSLHSTSNDDEHRG